MIRALLLAALLTACHEEPAWQPDHAVGRTEATVLPHAEGAWLERYPRPGAPAVVLVHGVSSNRHFFDLDPEHSLALGLFDAGYDVWLVDLPGHGLAQTVHPHGLTIDEHATRVLPAVFAHVRAAGPISLHYVGHSMGGMILAAYLAHTADHGLDSAVMLGSPLDFTLLDELTRTALDGGRLAPRRTATPAWARLLADIAPHGDLASLLYNPDNLSVSRQTLRSVVSPLHKAELRQIQRRGDIGWFGPDGGDVAYIHQLQHLQLPLTLIAGRADVIAPPWRLSPLQCPGCELWVAGPENGTRQPYGHLDLGLGDHMKEEILPVILRGLRRRQAVAALP